MSVVNLPLANKVAIVTGGAGGLGRAIAKTLAESGATIIVFDRDSTKLHELPHNTQYEQVDITSEGEVLAAIGRVIERNGCIDILINNAGVIFNEPLINITKTERRHDYAVYKKMMDINLNSVFLMASVVAEQMVLKRTRGVIINISSICSEGNPGQTAYSAAKAGVNAFTKTWAKELGPFGIRVVAISPGFINTESTSASLDASLIQALTKRIPLRKLGMSDDIAHAVLSVVQNQYINGSIIDVHGGLSL